MSRPGIADLDDDDLVEEEVQTGSLPGQGDSPENVPAVPEPVEVAQGRPRPALALADLPEPEETKATGPLSAEEEDLLDLCMRGIQQFENAWWVMGKSLANINARRLYRKTHATFEDFCRDVLNKSRPTAYEEINSYAIGELLSARADKTFEENSNRMSARADTSIGKKAAAALNPITQDYGAAVSVAVVETIQDATGKKVPVKTITGVVQQLPRKQDQELTQDELVALARELAVKATPEKSSSGGTGKLSEPSGLASLRAAVSELESAYRKLAPAKVKQAIAEDADETAKLLAEAGKVAIRVRDRAQQK
ncbi:hypothetical protein ACFY2W_36215 [Streptomyces sp. NPDC001262]|uniref:hypothetical protein n=1 Tax=Streptomyces sp. NPDC001262 TaxID=3364552 RepID=UPI0036A9A573